ncbi:nuclear transport factor 2 family protein [Paraburkholderia sp. J8-2]|uniref:nuclear transport factor 2 family protein n=1 Tax=Paraburkholderia sp. J8-2 TaxID=2805440 RepID=UPI002AB6E2FB|nr:nuclear transport factor 2 family protein [Paraburkholderia sp. J8-2]
MSLSGPDGDATVTFVANRLLIEELIVRYAKARDTTDAELYRQIFAEDAQIRLPTGKVLSDGLQQILDVVATDQIRFNPEHKQGGASYAVMRHVVTNIDIHIDGETASSDYYVMTLAYNVSAKKPEFVSQARNVDTYILRDGRWLIASSTLHYDWGNDEMAKALAIGPHTPEKYRRH